MIQTLLLIFISPLITQTTALTSITTTYTSGYNNLNTQMTLTNSTIAGITELTISTTISPSLVITSGSYITVSTSVGNFNAAYNCISTTGGFPITSYDLYSNGISCQISSSNTATTSLKVITAGFTNPSVVETISCTTTIWKTSYPSGIYAQGPCTFVTVI